MKASFSILSCARCSSSTIISSSDNKTSKHTTDSSGEQQQQVFGSSISISGSTVKGTKLPMKGSTPKGKPPQGSTVRLGIDASENWEDF